jgi:RNA polymerase subunit RPABC4/transcription elongation factor Spt4
MECPNCGEEVEDDCEQCEVCGTWLFDDVGLELWGGMWK